MQDVLHLSATGVKLPAVCAGQEGRCALAQLLFRGLFGAAFIATAFAGPAGLQRCFDAACGSLVEGDFKFHFRGRGYTLLLGSAEAALAFVSGANNATVLRVRFIGGDREAKSVELEQLPGKSNYFLGSDPKNWRTNVPTYGKVRFRAVYPGVDIVYRATEESFEYDFELAPEASPRAIRMDFEGAEKVVTEASGDLRVRVHGRDMFVRKPVAYQNIMGSRRAIPGRYRARGKKQFGVELARYDDSKPIVIDPVLTFSTYLGGWTTDESGGIAIDSSGNIYVTGNTVSDNFPTSAGAYLRSCRGCPHFPVAFVTKLDPTGSTVFYSTFIGGRVSAENPLHAAAIAVDAAGNAYITGDTFTADFPTTAGAFITNVSAPSAAFAVKLDASGSLVYSTYLGPSGSGSGIAVDSLGSAYVVGSTSAVDFPTTAGAFQRARAGAMPSFDAFIVKLDPSGSEAKYATYLGGSDRDSGDAIAVDDDGNAYISGTTNSRDFPTTPTAFQKTYGGVGGCCSGVGDAFVTKLNSTGSALIYSTFLGGDQGDIGSGIALNGTGDAFVTGFTYSLNFPTSPGSFRPHVEHGDGYIARVNRDGSALVYATYLGGAASPPRVAVDVTDTAVIVGHANSDDFPTASPVQATGGELGVGSAFVEKLNASGSVPIFSTFLGGKSAPDVANAIVLDKAGNAYVAGQAVSTDFPTTQGALQSSKPGGTDVFVAKISNIRLPVASVSTSEVRFADQLVGGTSAAVTVSLTNNGDAALNISEVSTSADFPLANSCGASLPAGSRCAIELRFVPVTGGRRSGLLTIGDDAYRSPHTVSLSGTGINPVPAVSSLSSFSEVAGGPAFTLTVAGSNFVPGETSSGISGSVVRWNGVNKPTTFVSSGKLTAAISARDLAAPGVAQISVFNPEPGGGSSNPLILTVTSPQFSSTNAASYAPRDILAPSTISYGGAAKIAPALLIAPEGPWPTALGGVQLEITDSQGQSRLAPIYFVSTDAIGYLVPADVVPGPAAVRLTTSTGAILMGAFNVDVISPGLFTANASGSGAPAGFWIRVAADGGRTQDYLFDATKPTGSRSPAPIDLGTSSDQLYLSLYGTGFRNAERASATVGGVSVPVYGFAPAAAYQGEDVVNIGPLPRSLAGRGEVSVLLTFDGKPANTVVVAIH